jgi:hypothetical protein
LTAVRGGLPPAQAEAILKDYQKRRHGWLGHWRSFVATNVGLLGINAMTMIGAESFYPWALYVTASWGIGLISHGLAYRGWLRDHGSSIAQAEGTLGVARHETIPARGLVQQMDGAAPTSQAPPALPDASAAPDEWWDTVERCHEAVDQAIEALLSMPDSTGTGQGVVKKLEASLPTIEHIGASVNAIGEAIREVAPEGKGNLDDQLQGLERKIDSATDERLQQVYAANQRLLVARRDKLQALEAEKERMVATVQGFTLAAQNLRLDATRLGTGELPNLANSLSDSLDRLNEEVDIARQVESELENL